MAQEYKIEKVSEQEPRLWKGPHGDVYYIKVKLAGHDKPVSIGKKKPDALSVGMTVYGTIEESDLPEDKFKAENRPDGARNSSHDKPDEAYWQDKQAQIRAQWAIGQAVQLHIAVTANGGEESQGIETTAKELFAMVDRVKLHVEHLDEVQEIDPKDVDIINIKDIPF